MGYNLLVDRNNQKREVLCINPIAEFMKQNRKAAGLTQQEFAIRSGLGLRFVRELERGKKQCARTR